MYTYRSCTHFIHTLHTHTSYIPMICTRIIHIIHTLKASTSHARMFCTRTIPKDDRSCALMVHVKTMQVIHTNPHLERDKCHSRLLSPTLVTPQLRSWPCLKPFVSVTFLALSQTVCFSYVLGLISNRFVSVTFLAMSRTVC